MTERLAVITMLLFTLVGCVNVQRDAFQQDEDQYALQVDEVRLYTIEFDDGLELLPEQAERFYADVEQGLTERNILVFTHGWHHNASPDDKNYLTFINLLISLNKGEKKYTGVYLGWRGDEFDFIGGNQNWTESIADFHTI